MFKFATSLVVIVSFMMVTNLNIEGVKAAAAGNQSVEQGVTVINDTSETRRIHLTGLDLSEEFHQIKPHESRVIGEGVLGQDLYRIVVKSGQTINISDFQRYVPGGVTVINDTSEIKKISVSGVNDRENLYEIPPNGSTATCEGVLYINGVFYDDGYLVDKLVTSGQTIRISDLIRLGQQGRSAANVNRSVGQGVTVINDTSQPEMLSVVDVNSLKYFRIRPGASIVTAIANILKLDDYPQKIIVGDTQTIRISDLLGQPYEDDEEHSDLDSVLYGFGEPIPSPPVSEEDDDLRRALYESEVIERQAAERRWAARVAEPAGADAPPAKRQKRYPSSVLDTKCTVCLGEELEGEDGQGPLVKTKCGHLFHEGCLESVIDGKCPNCRKDLVTGN